MKVNVYKNDRTENIKMFSDIQSSKGYSSYATNLNRVFGEKNYDNFYKSLISPKEFKDNTFIKLFEKDNSTQTFKRTGEFFNLKLFKESLNNMQLKENEKNRKLKNPFYEKLKTSNNILLKKEYDKQKNSKINRAYCPKVPEVGHYNPSYSVINKHTYQVSFGNLKLKSYFDKNYDENYNKTERNNNQISLKKNIEQNIIPETSKYIKNFKSISINNNILKKLKNVKNNEGKTYKNGIIKNLKKSNKSMDKSNFTKTYNDSENHCLKFEVYTSRKPLSKQVLYNTSINFRTPNYYNDKYIHGCVDFNKLSINIRNKSYFDQYPKKQNNPPLGHYHPKFDSVFNKTKDIYLTKKEIENPKKRKLKQIIYSYKVNSNYEMVPSLNSYCNVNTEGN